MTNSKDAKLLITKLQFLVNKLNRFKDFMNSIDITVSGELELEQLQLRVKQTKLLANEYAELTAQATSFTVTFDDLPSCEEFEEQYILTIAQASLILKNKGTSGLQSPSNSLSHLVTPQASCNVKLPMLNTLKRIVAVKCAMCPKKNATLDDSNAVKCNKCGLLYHPSCAKRAKINADGWVSFCCYSTAADEVNEVNDLDENSRVLFKLIEAKFNGLEVKFNGLDSKIDNTLITVKEKLCELDDRVLKLEDNNVYLLENVISEINKRNSKECNCIIYKLEDSENAVKKDIELFKNLLACCNDEPSFNINDIKLIRLGETPRISTLFAMSVIPLQEEEEEKEEQKE
ncbi:hypothetical protein FQA39_LY17553 [Lamprigera yunnana]|nr:hypothetical protein FQA39_LY17553 [Lamprigera yunnana]